MMIESLQRELANEMKKTRTQLERLPDDKLDWRPHAKSYSARDLGSHLVDCVRWGESIFSADELNFETATFRPYRAATVAELLESFDGVVASCTRALAGASEEMLMQPWRFKINGKVRFERSRWDVFRDFTMSHVIHHRGQLSVYLRLLDVPVPGSYGPTADEKF